jgi:hypothetical protein
MCVLGYGVKVCNSLLHIPIVDCVHIQLIRDLMNQNVNNEILSLDIPGRNRNYLFRNFRSCVRLKSFRLSVK